MLDKRSRGRGSSPAGRRRSRSNRVAELPSVWVRSGRVVFFLHIRWSGWVGSVGYWVGSDWVKKFEPMYICDVDACARIQEAVAICFETEQQQIDSPESYFNSISEELRPKRDKIAKVLEEIRAVPTIPDGGYFMVADFSNFSKL